jgi:hypothetical protein
MPRESPGANQFECAMPATNACGRLGRLEVVDFAPTFRWSSRFPQPQLTSGNPSVAETGPLGTTAAGAHVALLHLLLGKPEDLGRHDPSQDSSFVDGVMVSEGRAYAAAGQASDRPRHHRLQQRRATVLLRAPTAGETQDDRRQFVARLPFRRQASSARAPRRKADKAGLATNRSELKRSRPEKPHSTPAGSSAPTQSYQ